MTNLTDTQKAAMLAITEERVEELVNAHREIKAVDPDLVAAIFQAGMDVGCSSLIYLVSTDLVGRP